MLTKEEPAPGNSSPQLVAQDVRCPVPAPGTPHAELDREVGAEGPHQRQPPQRALAAPQPALPAETDHLRKGRRRVHVQRQLVHVAFVVDAVLDPRVRVVQEAVVRLLRGEQRLQGFREEVRAGRGYHAGDPELGLHLGQGGDCAQRRADEADEGDGGVVAVPDVADVGVKGGRVRAWRGLDAVAEIGVGISVPLGGSVASLAHSPIYSSKSGGSVVTVEKRKYLLIAGAKYQNIRLNPLVLHTFVFGSSTVAKVNDPFLVDTLRPRSEVNLTAMGIDHRDRKD